MDGGRGEVLQILGGPEQRLLHLHPGLPLQQRLLQMVAPAGSTAGGNPSTRADAGLGRSPGLWRAVEAKELVGRGAGVDSGTAGAVDLALNRPSI